MKTNCYLRQNHKKAVTYLKSSQQCFKRENTLIYLVIILSVLFCLLGLIFSMLPKLTGLNDPSIAAHADFMKLCDVAVKTIGLLSGIFLVVQMALKVVMQRLHIEGVNSIERFDTYVYDMIPNKMIIRPINDAAMQNNSIKIRSSDANYTNTYFQQESEDDVAAIYNNQRELFVNNYHLLMYVKSKFFIWLWGSFAVIIFVFAVWLDENFLATLLNVFFPSISIISLIVSSMITYSRSIFFLQNTLSVFEAADKNAETDKRSETVLRLNQDAIFSYRMNSFNVPLFLIKMYERSAAKQKRMALADDSQLLPKTCPYIQKTYEHPIVNNITIKEPAEETPAAKPAKNTAKKSTAKTAPKVGTQDASKAAKAENKTLPRSNTAKKEDTKSKPIEYVASEKQKSSEKPPKKRRP